MHYLESGPGPRFDPFEFLAWLKDRWLIAVLPCAVALSLTVVVSLVLPNKYTATSQVLIQPPVGNDPRAATAISPVYLDSLKAYERIASGDLLFSRALDHIGMAPGTRSVQVLKRSMLDVRKLLNTAVLEINATTNDPRKAQALAQYIAEQTVEITRSMNAQSQADTVREFRTQFTAAQARLVAARDARAKLNDGVDAQALATQMDDNADLKLEIEKELARAQSDFAGQTAELQTLSPSSNDDTQYLNREAASGKARIAALEQRRSDLAHVIADDGRQLAARTTRERELDAEESAAQIAFEAANTRLNEASTAGAYSGERLKVIDPGTVPQEPSSPNIPLNLLAALIVSGVGSFTWLAFSFGYRGAVRERSHAVSRDSFTFTR